MVPAVVIHCAVITYSFVTFVSSNFCKPSGCCILFLFF